MNWEYKRIALPRYRKYYNNKELNQYGEEGWKLIRVYGERVNYIDNIVYVFKRLIGK